MNYIQNASGILIEVVFGIAVSIFIARVLIDYYRISYANQISQAVYKFTQPIIKLLGSIIPSIGKLNLSAMIAGFIIVFVKISLVLFLSNINMDLPRLIIYAFADYLNTLLDIFFWLLIIRVILSWVRPSGYNPAVHLLVEITNPIMNFAQRIIPSFGGIDFSPIILFLAITLSRELLVRPIYMMAIS